MTNGNRYVIAESIDEITDRIRVFRASLLSLAAHMGDHPSVAGTARLRVVRGPADGADRPHHLRCRGGRAMKKMDRMTPMAVGGALVAIFASMIVDGSSPTLLFKPAPIILVFGGTILAAAAGFMKSDVTKMKDVLKKAMGPPEESPDEDIAKLVSLAELARRDGLLALDKAAETVEDPFFRRGLQMTADGIDPEEIQDIMEGEILAMKERHKMGAKFFGDMGGFSPTLGIIGTVIGLIHVLANLSNPNVIGPAIGSAFTATLWGVMAANVLWLPISNKLKRVSELEIHHKKMVLDGLLAIQAGSSPRLIQTRLQSYLSTAERNGGSQNSKEAA